MITLLKEYVEGSKLIREYTKDGTSVSHKIETLIQDETAGEIIELPENPLLKLQQENVQLKSQLAQNQQEIADTNALLLEFMEASMI